MEYVFQNYARWDLEIASGSGTKVYDIHGKEYLDFTSGIGVCNLGHCHPEVTAAVTEQLQTIWHTSNLFKSSLQNNVAKKLVEASVGDAVFFCNSGAEANEAAIKLARKYTGKHKIITFFQSFHGRTLGTMAATGQEKVKQGFGPMLETFIHLPFNDIEALRNEIDSETAAVMLEVIQGEGGVHPAEENFLMEAEKLCKAHGALLIVDEVQTGNGRTGVAFAYEHYHISPDIITTAKGLGNGFPVGAMIGKDKLKSAFNPGSHGSTFGGNPLAMVAANSVLNIILNQEFLDEVDEKGELLYLGLRKIFSEIKEFQHIRQKGLMIGIEFSNDVSQLLSQLRNNGLLVLPAGPNVLRLLPPLTVSEKEIEDALLIMEKTVIKNKVLNG